MSELHLFYPACLMIEKSDITAGDVDLLETRPSAHHPAGREDFSLVLAIHNADSRKCVEWEPFFIDQAVAEIISQVSFLGADAELIEWVRQTFCRNGIIASRAEFEAIVRVVEILRDGCTQLASFALKQIHIATVEQDGPLADRRGDASISIAPENLDFVNRILTALGNQKTLSAPEVDKLCEAVGRLSRRGGTPFDDIVARLKSGGQIAA